MRSPRALTRRRSIKRKPDSRVIELTPSGARGLYAVLAVEQGPDYNHNMQIR
jgi:hypothetical protein